MTPLIPHLLPAAVLGLCVAIPFGPVGMMCVQRTPHPEAGLAWRVAWVRQQRTEYSVIWR